MRPEQHLGLIPGIRQGSGKKVLYVGANRYRAYGLTEFLSWGYTADILEIWEDNLSYINKKYSFNNVILGDVMKIDSEIEGDYDVILWWHGPEHIEKDKIEDTLKKIESKCKIVVLGFPIEGPSDVQGAEYGNPHEAHLWRCDEATFKKLGYSTKIIPRRGNPPHCTAWKHVSA